MKILMSLLLLMLLNINNVYGLENKILFKVNNEIITTIDISNEINYLKSINNKIDELEKNTIIEIAKNSIIKEKIKEIEIKKNVNELKINENDLKILKENLFKRIGFSNLVEFEAHLKSKNVNIEKIEEKLILDTFWNQMIYLKYKDQIKIDKEKITNEVSQKKIKTYQISEIVFRASNKEEINKKYEKIKQTIELDGFEKAAIIHSISETSKNGGNIGWIKETSLSPIILTSISKISKNENTKPISIPGGFIILKINDYKEKNITTNLEEEINKTIRIQTNTQLNQFSNIYFNKIKKDIKINEL